ncbi:hypothetical protein OROGR_006184 [Orobanche gracilis]
MGKTTSQDHCPSSDSCSLQTLQMRDILIHHESYGKHGQDMKAALFLHNPVSYMNVSQAEISQPILHYPYAYADPYFTGLYAAYGPHNMPQVMAAASCRIPLPADIPEDGPIYVNAKQYHGILRRRQTRAKLEAQNKLLKNRKPYLHESRHQHALNRVRGSGGRFLSSKKDQYSDSTSSHSSNSNNNDNNASNSFLSENYNDRYDSAASTTTESTARASTGDAISHQEDDGRYPSSNMHGSGGLVYNGNCHYASIVR